MVNGAIQLPKIWAIEGTIWMDQKVRDQTTCWLFILQTHSNMLFYDLHLLYFMVVLAVWSKHLNFAQTPLSPKTMILMLDLDCLGSQIFFGSVCGGVGVGGWDLYYRVIYWRSLEYPSGNSGIIYRKQLCILIEFSFETRYVIFALGSLNTEHFPFYCTLMVYNFTSSPCIFQWCTCVIMMNNNIDHFQYLFPKCFCMACPLIHVPAG